MKSARTVRTPGSDEASSRSSMSPTQARSARSPNVIRLISTANTCESGHRSAAEAVKIPMPVRMHLSDGPAPTSTTADGTGSFSAHMSSTSSTSVTGVENVPSDRYSRPRRALRMSMRAPHQGFPDGSERRLANRPLCFRSAIHPGAHFGRPCSTRRLGDHRRDLATEDREHAALVLRCARHEVLGDGIC